MESQEFTLKNGKKITIRQAELNDAEALLKFSGDIFEDDEFFLTTRQEIKEHLTFEKQKERIKEFVNKQGKVLLVAEADGVIVGTSEVDNGNKKRRQHVGRIGMSVLKEYRDIGCGTALLQSIIEWAKEDVLIEKLGLEVFASNAVPSVCIRSWDFANKAEHPGN